MSKNRGLRLFIDVLHAIKFPIARLWNRLPSHCSYCCHPIAADSISKGESSAWCPNCHEVFELPLLKAPNWIVGVLAILLINMY